MDKKCSTCGEAVPPAANYCPGTSARAAVELRESREATHSLVRDVVDPRAVKRLLARGRGRIVVLLAAGDAKTRDLGGVARRNYLADAATLLAQN